MRIRTGYSFRTAAGKIEDVMSRLVECQYSCAPISDRASTFGWVRWKKLALKNGLKPIFGVELAVTGSINAKKPSVDHWTFFAIDDIACVNELVQLATSQFRYEPLLTYEQASTAPGVIKIVGNRSDLSQFTPRSDLFVALSPSCSKGYISEAEKLGFDFIASSDNKFVREEDEGFYEILCGRGASTQTYAQHIQSADEWQSSVNHIASQSAIDQAMANFILFPEQFKADLKQAQLLTAEKPLTLEQMCRNGAEELGIDLTDPVYAARLQRELDLIKLKEFEDYFYIIADIMAYARPRMICGPARGSSCGSLVCYLLKITTIDPIPYNLLFERFIDITRSDLPDIDIDFSDQKRDMVFAYMENKYGRDRVARLGTVALFKPRSAIDEAGTALGVPRWLCDKMLDGLIVRSGGDSRALQTLEDTFNETAAGRDLFGRFPEILVAAKMEGHPRHHSQHAAGIVVTETPVTDYVAVDVRTGATHCDKKDAEELNLLKIDALGLTQLSVFEDALTMASLPIDHLESVPLDDPATFEVFNRKAFSGIFQFNGAALQNIVNQVPMRCFDDIVSTTALARPGPMTSGGTSEWIKRKLGEHPVTYPHPTFEPYLKDTLGIVSFQEQIMEICREVGDLSWEDVTALRKAMSKSLGAEYFNQFGDRFKEGAFKKGIPPETLDKLWTDLCSYGAWCVSGDTLLKNPYHSQHCKKFFTVKELYERNGKTEHRPNCKPKTQKIFCMHKDGIRPLENLGVFFNGVKKTFVLQLESHSIRATKEHKVFTQRGWVELGKLLKSDLVAVEGERQLTIRKAKTNTGRGRHNWRQKELAGEELFAPNVRILRKKFKRCQECRKAPYEETHHIDMNHENHKIENLRPVCRKCHKKLHAQVSGAPIAHTKGRAIAWEKIVKIEPFGEEEVFDISMPAPHHNFIANGIVVHNCFNKSHAVAYGMISYWCGWMKAHYPVEFAAATLSHEKLPARQIMTLREMAAEGVTYLPFDAEHSTDKWTSATVNGQRQLIGPLSNVKGIGPKMLNSVLSARRRGEPMPPRVEKILERGRTAVDSLWPVKDAFNRLMPDPAQRNIHSLPTPVEKIQSRKYPYHAMIFGVVDAINPRDENEAINVAKRNGRILTGPTQSLNLQVRDDTDRIFCKVDRFKFEKLGREIVDRGRPGKALYALKGVVPEGFRMLRIEAVRFIGFLDDEAEDLTEEVNEEESADV